MEGDVLAVETADDRDVVRCSVCGDSENVIVDDVNRVCSLCYWVSRKVGKDFDGG